MSDKRKFILTDADGVLLDWRQGFLDWLPPEVAASACPEGMKQYNFNDAFDYSKDHIDNLAVKFNESADIGRLDPWRDAVKYVKLLGEAGFTFHVCSAMGGGDISRMLRAYNLHTLFGDHFGMVDTLPVGASKEAWLLQFAGTGYYWLEDHVGHAQDGHDLGLKSVLFSDVSNAHHTNLAFPRVSETTPWQDLYYRILNDYNS